MRIQCRVGYMYALQIWCIVEPHKLFADFVSNRGANTGLFMVDDVFATMVHGYVAATCSWSERSMLSLATLYVRERHKRSRPRQLVATQVGNREFDIAHVECPVEVDSRGIRDIIRHIAIPKNAIASKRLIIHLHGPNNCLGKQ